MTTLTKHVTEVLLTNPTIDELIEGWRKLKEHPKFQYRTRIHVAFSKPVKVQINRRKAKELSSMDVKFFLTASNQLCYTFYSRTGYYVSPIDFKSITSLSFTPVDDPEAERVKKLEALLRRRYDDATWSDLTPDNLRYQDTNVLSLTRRFPKYVLDALEDAFKNKTDYSHTMYRTKRDWRVQTKMGEDGVFRAWFSSEYSGCGNGNYYLLLNPTTATFGERD